MRDDLLVRGDDRFPGDERRTNPFGGRLDAANRLDDDVRVAREDVADVRRPENVAAKSGARGGQLVALGGRAAVEDLCQLEPVDRVGAREPRGDGGADRAEAKERDATASGGKKAGAGAVARLEEERSDG